MAKKNVNRYLNLELEDENNSVELIGNQWLIVILGPLAPHTENFEIIKLKAKEHNMFKDNPEDPGNKEILTEFLSYLEEKIHIKEDN